MDQLRTLAIALDRTTERDLRTYEPRRSDKRVRRGVRLSDVLMRH